MRKERHWLIFRKDEPENEWEAKYIVQQNKTDSWASIALVGLLILFLSIALVSINLHPCEAEFEGSLSGVLDLNENIIPNSPLNKLVLTKSEGKFKASGSCIAVSMFSMRRF